MLPPQVRIREDAPPESVVVQVRAEDPDSGDYGTQGVRYTALRGTHAHRWEYRVHRECAIRHSAARMHTGGSKRHTGSALRGTLRHACIQVVVSGTQGVCYKALLVTQTGGSSFHKRLIFKKT